MTIRFTADALIFNGQKLTKDYDKKAIGEHIKIVLFGEK